MEQKYKYNKRLYTKNFRKVSSKAISSLDYDELHKILEIEFTGGKIYHYQSIENKIWNCFLSIIKNDESLGTYVNQEFKKIIENQRHEYHELV